MSQVADFSWPSAVASNATASASFRSVPLPVTTSTASDTGAFFSSASHSDVFFSSAPLVTTATITSTASDTGAFFSSGVVSTPTSGPRTTIILITSTVTVTPTATSSSSMCSHPHAPAEICTHTSQFLTETSLPQSSDVSGPFLVKAAANIPDGPCPAFTASLGQLNTRSSPINHGPLIGGIVGTVLAFVTLILLARYFSTRSKSKPNGMEHGAWPTSRHLSPYPNEVPGRGRTSRRDTSPGLPNPNIRQIDQEPSRNPLPMSQSSDLNPVDVAHAYNFQNGLGIDGYQDGPRGHATPQRPSSTTSSFGMSPSALAQARAWDTPFGSDNFQPTPTYGGNSRSPPPQFKPLVSVRKIAPLRKPRAAMPARKPVPPHHPVADMPPVSYPGRAHSISPLSEEEMGHIDVGRSNYSDVSPLNSPKQSPQRKV